MQISLKMLTSANKIGKICVKIPSFIGILSVFYCIRPILGNSLWLLLQWKGLLDG